jgi:hypothetical protein
VKGSQLDALIATMPPAAREATIAQLATSIGNLPSWFSARVWPLVVIKSGGHELRLRVAPDYLAIGEDGDFRRVALTPQTAQLVANAYGAILPSRALVRAIYGAADVRVRMPTFPPDAMQESSAMWIADDARVSVAAAQLVGKLQGGSLAAGHRKNVVTGPGLDGSRVAIFGGLRDPSAASWWWQPYSTIHGSSYTDHSHGIRLVSRAAVLDGLPVDLGYVFTHPELHPLVSDQGPYVPAFPNAGPSAQSLAALPPVQAPTAPPAQQAPAESASTGLQAFGLVSAILGVVSFFRGRR